MAEITPADRVKIAELRDRVGIDLLAEHPTFNTDYDMLRWLQGFDYNIDVIVPKLRDHLRLRSAWEIDTIHEHYELHPIFRRKLVHFGPIRTPERITDYTVVAIECFGKDDFEGFSRSLSMTEIYKWLTWLCEAHYMRPIRERERATGKQSAFITVQDFEGLAIGNVNMLKFASCQLRCYLKFVYAQYVNVLRKSILINLPPFAYYIWNYVILPFMPQKTKEKIVILGPNWREEILNHVDAAVLPVYWGGELVDEDGDEMCRSKINIPSKVPAEMYWSAAEDKERYGEEHFTAISVPAGQRLEISVSAESGTRIEWIVHGESAYVFSIEYSSERRSDENAQYVVQKVDEKVETEEVFPRLEMPGNTCKPEEDLLTCRRTGTYVLCFRNEAWFAKTQMRVRVLRNGVSMALAADGKCNSK